MPLFLTLIVAPCSRSDRGQVDCAATPRLGPKPDPRGAARETLCSLVIFDIGGRNLYLGAARKVERLPTHLASQVTNQPLFLRCGGIGLAKRSGIASGSGD